MKMFRFAVSLRIWHPTIDLGAIANELGMVSRPSIAAGSGIYYPTCFCSERQCGHDEQILDVIEGLVKELHPKAAFLNEITEGGGRIELFIGWFQSTRGGGEIFNSDLLARLGSLHIDLAFDVYGTNEEPDDLHHFIAEANQLLQR